MTFFKHWSLNLEDFAAQSFTLMSDVQTMAPAFTMGLWGLSAEEQTGIFGIE